MRWLKYTASAYESNDEHLGEELDRVAGLLRAQLQRFRLSRPEALRQSYWHATDEYLDGLSHDDEHSPLASFEPPREVRRMLEWAAMRRAAIDQRIAATRNRDLRLARLASEFGLSAEEIDAILIALLPSLHSTYRHWLGILQQEPARAQATVGLIIEMLAKTGADYAGLFAMLSASGRLARSRLLVLAGVDGDPLATRAAFVDDRVAMHLFGIDGIDQRAVTVVRWFDDAVELRALPLTTEQANRLEMLPNLRAAEPDFLARLRVKFIGPDPDLAVRAFATVVAGLHRPLLVIDVDSALDIGIDWPLVIDLALREARLAGGVPLFTGVGRLLDSPEHRCRYDQLMSRLAEFPHPAAIEIGSGGQEDPRAGRDWIPFHLGAPTVGMREQLWQRLLETEPNSVADREAVAPGLARSFQLTHSQIRDAWRTAESLARHRNVFIASVESDDLFGACRHQSAKRLVAFAQRIEPRRNLKLDRDIVLPAPSMCLLSELRGRIRNYARIHSAMSLGEHMRLGRGVTALFVGGSGTGKTMAAEVLASEQQIDLYRIDLAALVSKWVGETEKNLSRIFADAERANCMLFFDEADSIFGRRGEVKEAHDRWANLEVNFLLQRIEDYSGVVILATNLRQNIDDAFQRRIHVVVEFPVPDAAARRAIWRRLLPEGARCAVRAEDVDEIAQRFELTGGNIRNVVLDACFRALAAGDGPVTTRHLAASTAREFQKTARPVTSGDFGRFYDWAMQDVVAPLHPPLAGKA